MTAMLKPEPKGIGGWLVLLAFVLIGLPARIDMSARAASAAFASQDVAPLIESGSSSYCWAWAALYVCEVPMYSLLLPFSVALIPLFFLKHRLFPLTFGIFAAGVFAINTMELVLSLLAPGITPEYQTAIIEQRTLGSASIICWTLYLFRSRRARNTFNKALVLSPFPPFFRTYETAD